MPRSERRRLSNPQKNRQPALWVFERGDNGKRKQILKKLAAGVNSVANFVKCDNEGLFNFVIASLARSGDDHFPAVVREKGLVRSFLGSRFSFPLANRTCRLFH